LATAALVTNSPHALPQEPLIEPLLEQPPPVFAELPAEKVVVPLPV
jgi:hypothetical protein